MLKSFKVKTRVCNVVCALLALCLLILQFTPFWDYGSGSMSISGYVWLDCSNTEIASWFSTQLGSESNINSIVITAVLVLLLGAASVIVCLIKSDIGLASLLPAATSLCALYAFAFKPVFRLGSTWIIQLVLSVVMLVFAVMAIVYGFKKNEQEESGKVVLSENDINACVEAIKALGYTDSKKSKIDDSDTNFYKLLSYLTDEVPQCRAAAVETLGKTSRDAAFTNIVYLLNSEKDETVIKAMRNALISIRKNEKLEHSERN